MESAADVLVGVLVFGVQRPVFLHAYNILRFFLSLLEIYLENFRIAAGFEHLQVFVDRLDFLHLFGGNRCFFLDRGRGLRGLGRRLRRLTLRLILERVDFFDLHHRGIQRHRHRHGYRARLGHRFGRLRLPGFGRCLHRRLGRTRSAAFAGGQVAFDQGFDNFGIFSGFVVFDQHQHLGFVTFLLEVYVGQ